MDRRASTSRTKGVVSGSGPLSNGSVRSNIGARYHARLQWWSRNTNGRSSASHKRLLRPCCERPRTRAAEQRDERAPVHCLVAPVLYSSTERIARGETVALRDLDSANVG